MLDIKIRVNYERERRQDSPDTSHCPLGETLIASDQTGSVRGTPVRHKHQQHQHNMQKPAEKKSRTARRLIKETFGTLLFHISPLPQTYLVDLLTFSFFFNRPKNDRQTLLHVCSFTAPVYNFNTKIFAF